MTKLVLSPSWRTSSSFYIWHQNVATINDWMKLCQLSYLYRRSASVSSYFSCILIKNLFYILIFVHSRYVQGALSIRDFGYLKNVRIFMLQKRKGEVPQAIQDCHIIAKYGNNDANCLKTDLVFLQIFLVWSRMKFWEYFAISTQRYHILWKDVR